MGPELSLQVRRECLQLGSGTPTGLPSVRWREAPAPVSLSRTLQ